MSLVRRGGKRKAFLIGMLIMAAGSSEAGELRVSVQGVRNETGQVRVALYRMVDRFATREGRFLEVVIPARVSAHDAVFSYVPSGLYGLAAFHDENANGDFDKNGIGFPLEGFGFGNDAPVFFGPPEFSDAAVLVDDTVRRVSLTLRYW